MAGFSWSEWLGLQGHKTPSRATRKPRQTKVPQVEGLEERTLLTANLPVALDDVYTMDEDDSLNGTSVLGNDTDADSDPIEAELLSGPSHGSLTLNPDGTFVYTPNADFNGNDSFTYYAKDALNSETSLLPATVTIQVTAVADAPVANAASFSTGKNTAFNGTLTGTDADDDALTFLPGSVVAEHGTVNINENGSFTYTPNAGYSGPDSFSFKTNDGTSDSPEATVTITVLSQAPVADAQSFNTDEDTLYSGTLTGSDADSDDLTFLPGLVEAQHGTVVINPDGTFTYTPNADFFGTDSFSFKTNDGSSDSAEALVSITINAINDAPVATPASYSTDKNVTLNGTLAAVDAEGDSVTFAAGTIATQHGVVNINSDGSFDYTPNAGYVGPDSFSFVANDGNSDGPEATISIMVLSQIPVADTQSFSTIQGTAHNGTLTGSDADGDTLTYLQGTVVAQHGVVVINLDGTFTYTPDSDYDGPDSFSFKTNDGTSDSSEALVTITVTNQIPVADIQSFNTDEDTLYNGTLTGSDPDSDPLTYVAGTVAASHGTVVINLDGTFTYTPDADFFGTDSFSFKTFDGTDYSVEALVSITVDPVNDAPVATPANFSTDKNVTLNGTLAAVDPEGDSVTFSDGTFATAHGSVTINSDGTFSYTPNAGYIGEDSFTFTADDGSGAGPEATVTITVVNNAPIADSTGVNATEDTVYDGTVTGSDPDSDSLTYAIGTVTPQHGTVTVNPDGSFQYTPNANFYGTDSFTFTTFDGTDTSTEATVTITVANVNDAPVANAATATTPTNVDLNGTLTASDLDGDTLTYLAGSITPAHGSVTINPDGTYTYTPAAGYSGVDSFSFKVNDGLVDSPEVLVAITILNAPPTVSNGTGITDEDTLLLSSVSPLGLDPNGDPLTYTVVTPPAHGTLVLSPDGVFVYIPDANYHGTDSFQFKANDGQVTSGVATFEITVTSVDDVFDMTLATDPKSILKNGLNVQIDGNASVGDLDTQVNYSGATVQISTLSGGNKHDVLSVKNQGTGIGLVKVKGSKIYFNASTTAVATFSGGRNGKPLQITFAAGASEAAVNAVLKQVGFKTVKSGGAGTRVIQYLVNAGGNTSQKTINVNVV